MSKSEVVIAKPCKGGRYCLISDTLAAIQCNCNFLCTSRNKRIINDPDNPLPYYYIPYQTSDESSSEEDENLSEEDDNLSK